MKKLIAISFFSLFICSAFAGGFSKPAEKNAPMKIRKRNARPDIPGTLLIELGWNLLQNDNPSIATELLGSRTLNFYYLRDIRVGNTNFFVLPGIGVGLDRYKFDEDVTLDRQADGTVNVDTVFGGKVKKSMLITNYLDIPLEVRFYTNPSDKKRSFKVGIGFKVGVLINSHTKIKQEVNGEMTKRKVNDNFALNRFRYGVTGRIGIGGFNVFYYSSLNTLFESDKGPLGTEANNVTVGLSFTGF